VLTSRLGANFFPVGAKIRLKNCPQLYAAFTHKHVFGYYDADDIFGCVADIGWITGHSYVVYGPLANGGTSVLFESTPNYPGKRLCFIVDFQNATRQNVDFQKATITF
jgi:acyl-coenzyme A synthetase/AMP-(fatty) acid ligase